MKSSLWNRRTWLRIAVGLCLVLVGIGVAQSWSADRGRRLEWLDQQRIYPRLSELFTVRSDDQRALETKLVRKRTASGKVLALWALGMIDPSKASITASNILVSGGNCVRWEERDIAAISSIINAVGLMGRTNDVSYEFLRNAVAWQFWKQHRSWSTPKFDRSSDGVCTSLAIRALELTGREEADQLLKKFRADAYTMKDGSRQRSFAGDIVDAKYYLDMQRSLGVEEFRSRFLNGDAAMRRKWKATPAGKEWYRWFYSSQGIPIPPEYR